METVWNWLGFASTLGFLICYVFIIVWAFKDDGFFIGLACLVCGCYLIYFSLFRFEHPRKWWIVSGFVLFFLLVIIFQALEKAQVSTTSELRLANQLLDARVKKSGIVGALPSTAPGYFLLIDKPRGSIKVTGRHALERYFLHQKDGRPVRQIDDIQEEDSSDFIVTVTRQWTQPGSQAGKTSLITHKDIFRDVWIKHSSDSGEDEWLLRRSHLLHSY